MGNFSTHGRIGSRCLGDMPKSRSALTSHEACLLIPAVLLYHHRKGRSWEVKIMFNSQGHTDEYYHKNSDVAALELVFELLGRSARA
jgi:hypothetical protein